MAKNLVAAVLLFVGLASFTYVLGACGGDLGEILLLATEER